MPGTIILKIDGKDVKIRWNEERKPTDADVAEIESAWRQRQAGKLKQSIPFLKPQAKAATTPPKKQVKAPAAPANPILQRIEQGTTTKGVTQAVDVFKAEAAKNPDVVGAFGKIPTADEVRQGRNAGETAGQYAVRKSQEATDAVKNNPAFSAIYELFGRPGTQWMTSLGLDPKELAAGVVTSPYDMSLDIGVLLSQRATPQEKAGALANIAGVDLALPAAAKGLTLAAKAIKNKQARAAVQEALKAYDLSPTKPLKSSVPETLSANPTSVLDEVLPPAKPQPKPTVEQMPPPVAQAGESPVRGTMGDAALPLAHRTSAKNADSILSSGFNLKNFGATSKKAGLNYKQDPLGVSFIEVANDVNASQGDAILYADNPLKNPFVLEADGKEWRRVLHDRFGTNGDGRKLSKAMQAEGYDGIVTRSGNDTAEIIVFDPATIRPRTERATTPTTSRYGPSYGTPQLGQGGRTGYPMRSALDEVLEPQKVDAPTVSTKVVGSHAAGTAKPSSDIDLLHEIQGVTLSKRSGAAEQEVKAWLEGNSGKLPHYGEGGYDHFLVFDGRQFFIEPGGAIREQGFYAKRQEGKPVVPYDPAIHGKQNTPANAPARAVETPEAAGAVVEPPVWKHGAKPWIWAPREDVAIDTRFTLEPLLRRTGVFGETSASQAVNPATNWGGATLGDILVDPAWRAEFPEQLGLRIKPMKPEEMPPNVRARLVQFGPLDDDIIEVRADLLKSDPNAVIEAVLHEAAHAKRKAMGRDLDQSLPYNEQAHELSARRYTKHLLENVGSDVGTNKAKPLGVGKLQDGVHNGGDVGVRAQSDTSGVRGVGEPGVRRGNPAAQKVRQSNPLEPPAQTVTPTSPTSARQADINADREALGKAGFSTDDVRKWSELEAKANPNAVPREGEGYKTGAWTDQETVNATAKLRELKAQIEELRASKADPETLVTLEDEFDNLTEAMYRSGTEQGRALASRRYTLDVDMSVDGLRARYKARAKKNGTPVDAKRLQELEQIAADYKRLQEQIDSGELVKARKRSKGPAKTKEELAEELSKMWDEFSAKDKNTLDEFFEDGVSSASNFTTERVAMIGKMAVKAVELGVATIDELVEAVAKQFRDRGLDAPDRATILNAWRTEREAGRRSVSEEVKAARAQRAKLEVEINAELDAPKKAEANAKKAAEAAENRARKAAERQQQAEANQKARAEEKARARAQREAADAEAKALREEQERILSERKAWDKRNRDRQREMERLNTRIAELEQSIEAGTGEGPKPRKQTLQDPELARAQNRMETLRKRARAIYKDQQPKPTWQRVTDATTSGRLLNPVNRGLDFLSGVSNIVNRAFIDGNVAALTSALSKDARVGSLLDPAKIKRVVDLMKSSDLARQLLDEGMYGNRGLGGKLAGMTDIPAKMFLYHVALDDMAFNIARRQLGKAPKEQITRRALDLLQNPTDEMVETATAEMLAQTYNTQTFVGAHLASTKSAMYKAMRGNDPGPIRSVAAGFTTGMFDMLTKFSNVITNVAKDRGARTLNIGGIPVSSAYAVGEFATKKIAKKAMATAERRHLQMLFAKGATGSAFTYLGYNYARELGIVPQISRNTNEEGKDPGNPYVDGGGVAGVLEQVGGFLTPFLWGAQLREIDEANLTDKQKSALKRQTLVEMAMSTPATGGMEKIVGLWQGRTSPWTFGGGVMASQMPGPVKMVGERLDAYNSSDPNDAFILRLFSKATERRTKVKESDGMTEAEAALWEFIRPIMRNTPMLREKLPEQDKKNVNR